MLGAPEAAKKIYIYLFIFAVPFAAPPSLDAQGTCPFAHMVNPSLLLGANTSNTLATLKRFGNFVHDIFHFMTGLNQR